MSPPIRWIWQRPNWPDLSFDARAAAADLGLALRWTGIVEGKASAIGLQSSHPLLLNAFAEEALATARIEGQVLPPDAVRSSALRRQQEPHATDHGQVLANRYLCRLPR